MPAVHRWIYNPPATATNEDYIDAMQVRLGTLRTPVRNSRGRPTVNTRCKCGMEKGASAQHIIQGCPLTHGLRVKRHNAVVKFIAKAANKHEKRIEMEKRIQTSEGLRKPDLYYDDGTSIQVIDVQVRADAGIENIEIRHEEKKLNYEAPTFKAAVKQQTGKNCDVTTVSFSWRGVMSMRSYEDCKRIGILTDRQVGTLAFIIVRDSMREYKWWSRMMTDRVSIARVNSV